MWKVEQEEYYLRVLDSRRQVAAYFDPDYGAAAPVDAQDEAVEALWKRREPILGGYLMVGLAKLGVYGAEDPVSLGDIYASLGAARRRMRAWHDALSAEGGPPAHVGVSHTDQDMLTVSFPVSFGRPVPLAERDVAAALSPILDRLQRQSLL